MHARKNGPTGNIFTDHIMTMIFDSLFGEKAIRTGLAVLLAAALGVDCFAQQAPTTYELTINGEKFLVESNRATKLKSKRTPEVSYDVSLRVSPVQTVRLPHLQFEFETPAQVELIGDGATPTARIVHELGFTALISDVGRPLDAEGQKSALKQLLESVEQTIAEMKPQKVESDKPESHRFANASALGASVRYVDVKGVPHSYVVCVFSDKKFSASCVVQYLDHDDAAVSPRIHRMLDSIKATE